MKPGDIFSNKSRLYSVCAQCGSLVRINKPLFGSLHLCSIPGPPTKEMHNGCVKCGSPGHDASRCKNGDRTLKGLQDSEAGAGAWRKPSKYPEVMR